MEDVRERLANKSGPRFWQSLDELAETPEFMKFLHGEFPDVAAAPSNLDRREFLALVAASLALTGLTACSSTVPEKIVPYVRQPEEAVPGRPLFFASAFSSAGYGAGVLVESHLGRPTKIEGNPEHPASRGSADAFTQASILTLYDPDRSQVITNGGRIATWDAFITSMSTELDGARTRRGEGVRFLTETVTSPTLGDQMRRILAQFPSAKWHRYDPLSRTSGDHAVYHFDKADVIVSLDSDFLLQHPDHLRNARDFTSRRRPATDGGMNRLYVIESTPSITGAMADQRVAARSRDVVQTARQLSVSMGGGSASGPGQDTNQQWLNAVIKDLNAHRGRSVIVPGEYQTQELHAIARDLNMSLGNVGQTVEYTSPVEEDAVDHMQSLAALVDDMRNGRVDMLFVIGGNPVYTAPSDLEFGQSLSRVRLRTHLGLYDDETSELCQWHIPETHFLESWGDIRSFDGTATIQQPLIEPLYGSKSAYEILSAVLGDSTKSPYEIVRDYWQQSNPQGDQFEAWWRKSVHDGVVAESKPRPAAAQSPSRGLPPAAQTEQMPTGLEVVIRPDPCVLDGRFANNAWLQELPKPVTKLTWDNAALISPATAQRLGLATEDVIEIRSEGRSVQAPVWIAPGQANESITLFLGYGRTRAGRIGSNRGYDANRIRTSASPWLLPNVEIRKTGSRYPLASTQHQSSMEDRATVRFATIDQFKENPRFAPEARPEPERSDSLYPEFVSSTDYAWGMAIDLSTCIGCNACTVACQAENNIPVVGKDQVANGRAMHWLRIDRYFHGDIDQPEIFFQPVLCMHCEKAPCEPVCPVGATTHSAEGLNEMTYNRCVGTRYCSNNCPYKVRRFNFLDYAYRDTSPVLSLLRNPNVTVRSRGVMEKCTYCVQRINQARITAKDEDRQIRDGEILTACQATCPADAIVFGNTADPESRVSRLKAESRNYGLLAELNTRPRTTYLAKITNPNPELKQ